MINLSTFREIRDRSRADVTNLLPDLDPTVDQTFIKAIVDSNAGRHYDNTLSLKQLEKELIPSEETSLDGLKLWANYEGIIPFTLNRAKGIAVFSGTVGSVLSAGIEVKALSGIVYSVDTESVISENSISVTLTRSGSTVTAVTPSDHGFATNLVLGISGADQAEYNGDQTITVISSTSFSYDVSTTPATPATGTILATADIAQVSVTSVEFGADQNLSSGAVLSLVNTISGVETDGYVSLVGIRGGTDVETASSLLRRIIHSRSNPVANFNVAAIEKQIFKIQGVTRTKIKRITPRVGNVTVLFLRDDDDNIIPDVSQVLEVKESILEILPVDNEEADAIVTAPTPVITDYIITSITPSTETMKAAIISNLKAYYRDEADFETDITEDKYKSIISNTIDTETGDTLIAFALSAPSGDITISVDEIGTLGDVTYP